MRQNYNVCLHMYIMFEVIDLIGHLILMEGAVYLKIYGKVRRIRCDAVEVKEEEDPCPEGEVQV